MSTSLLVFTLASLGLLAVAMLSVPSLSRPTVPLGVSVPRARLGEAVVRRSIARYRLWCALLAAGCVVGVFLTRGHEWAAAVWPLGYLVAAVGVFVWCRRPIARSKRAQGWYEGVPVRVSGPVTRQAPHVRVAWPVHLLSIALAVAGLVASAVARSGPPDLLTVLAIVIAVGVLALCGAVARRHDPLLPDGDPAAARMVNLATSRLLQTGLAWLSVSTSVLSGVSAMAQIGRLSPDATDAVIWGATLATLVPTAWMVWASVRARRAAVSGEPGADSPDDDAAWKWGLFYVNRYDPRAFVPKRNGVGLDPNFGHPVGLVLLGIVAALIVYAILSTLLGS